MDMMGMSKATRITADVKTYIKLKAVVTKFFELIRNDVAQGKMLGIPSVEINANIFRLKVLDNTIEVKYDMVFDDTRRRYGRLEFEYIVSTDEKESVMTLYYDDLGNIIYGLTQTVNFTEENARTRVAFDLIEKLLLLPRFKVSRETQEELLK